MTCRLPAAEGMRIDTQNVAGTRKFDLLRVADWFFPEGLNHHELFAGVPGLQGTLQVFARRVTGLGRLPKERAGAHEARRGGGRRDVDALVVGAGPAGMAVSLELTKRGRNVEVIDDNLRWGGSARVLAMVGEGTPWERLIDAFGEAVAAGRVMARVRTTAAGIYGDDILVAGEAGVEVLSARTLVLAPGANDGVLAFEGNDVPGVMSAHAAGRLASLGVAPGKRLLVSVAEGAGGFADAVARAFPAAIVLRSVPLRAVGSTRVRAAVLLAADGPRRVPCDALLIDAPRAPAYELCAQAGAALVHEERGFVVRAGGGKIRDGVFAVGEVVGTPLQSEAIAREAGVVAQRA